MKVRDANCVSNFLPDKIAKIAAYIQPIHKIIIEIANGNKTTRQLLHLLPFQLQAQENGGSGGG